MNISDLWPVGILVLLLLLSIGSARGDRESSGALVGLGAVVAVIVVVAVASASQLASIGVNVFGGVP